MDCKKDKECWVGKYDECMEKLNSNPCISKAMDECKGQDKPKKCFITKAKECKKFIEALRKVGPFSKQILNYSYPPLLYQRGDEEDSESVDEGECDEDEEDEETPNYERDWRNGVLVLVSTRLGLKKVGTEYFGPVKSFFMQQLNCGIIGGRPKEAYYLVGMQEDSLIFLDPHNTQTRIPNDLNLIKKNHI